MSAELVLVATMLVIGMIVGLTSLRNQVVQELADLGAALCMISQGYEYTGTSKSDDTTTFAVTDGSGWDDLEVPSNWQVKGYWMDKEGYTLAGLTIAENS